MLKPYEDALAVLEERGRLRQLALPAGYDFTSNDYLALADSQDLKDAVRSALDRGVAVGAGGSRILRGNYSEHESLEADAAAFFGGGSLVQRSLPVQDDGEPGGRRSGVRGCRHGENELLAVRASVPVEELRRLRN